ncbi:protein D3 [Scaptodrosophila lebanonensis]|uniref:Protein D3 n=1 Tax=Drosophila lebanonensis TaxID=7225 RepID=A0A6J2T652_DROLE|nr:protein D3 [Scaptodrosophila lebanonensis]XP_030371500.1 protein D3 [Scaptodrosophila lebanonensis]
MLLLSLLLAAIVAVQANSVEQVFKSHEVVPDVIPQAPNQFLEVSYSNGLKAKEGVELTPTQVKDQPKVEWTAAPSDYYTLIMTDPDAPSRAEPKFREFKHWVVVNIPGNDVSAGEALAEYVGSGPPKDTGLHRYVFLLYKQPGKLQFDEESVSNRSRRDRPKFSAAKFAEKYHLGNPVAGNFYQAEYDDYVHTLHSQLSES